MYLEVSNDAIRTVVSVRPVRQSAGEGSLSFLLFAHFVFGFLEALENDRTYFFEPTYTRGSRGLVTAVQALSVVCVPVQARTVDKARRPSLPRGSSLMPHA